MVRTCADSVIGLSTETVIGTEWPLSATFGRSSFTLPGITEAPFVKEKTSGSVVLTWAFAWPNALENGTREARTRKARRRFKLMRCTIDLRRLPE